MYCLKVSKDEQIIPIEQLARNFTLFLSFVLWVLREMLEWPCRESNLYVYFLYQNVLFNVMRKSDTSGKLFSAWSLNYASIKLLNFFFFKNDYFDFSFDWPPWRKSFYSNLKWDFHNPSHKLRNIIRQNSASLRRRKINFTSPNVFKS